MNGHDFAEFFVELHKSLKSKVYQVLEVLSQLLNTQFKKPPWNIRRSFECIGDT